MFSWFFGGDNRPVILGQHFDQLPDEIKLSILEKLDWWDIRHLAQTNSSSHAYIEANKRYLWKQRLRRLMVVNDTKCDVVDHYVRIFNVSKNYLLDTPPEYICRCLQIKENFDLIKNSLIPMGLLRLFPEDFEAVLSNINSRLNNLLHILISSLKKTSGIFSKVKLTNIPAGNLAYMFNNAPQYNYADNWIQKQIAGQDPDLLDENGFLSMGYGQNKMQTITVSLLFLPHQEFVNILSNPQIHVTGFLAQHNQQASKCLLM